MQAPRPASRIVLHLVRLPSRLLVAEAFVPLRPQANAHPGYFCRLTAFEDYDAFYCAVVEAAHPALKQLPLAVQQKQIIVTCNYEARRRGLHKLQLVKEARRLCPDLVIVLGEDLTRFRNASKDLYRFLRQFSWNGRVERLGFDEIWLDVTDQVDYNVNLLNQHDLTNAYFCLSKDDPTHGFAFDATRFAGNTYPASGELSNDDSLRLRLLLGSHLARHLRAELEHQKGYTATVGISTNKLLAKLVGNVKKPHDQTTLLPPSATEFVDGHDIGKIPGIGFKLAQKLRGFVLQRPVAFSDGLVYGGTEERVTAGDVRKHVGVSAERLERILGGPGSPHGIGAKVWGLLHGVDDSEVGQARDVPRQISIEDSYIRLDTLDEVVRELKMLAVSLMKRMHLDLLENDDGEICNSSLLPSAAEALTVRSQPAKQRWIAHPRTLRLSTRPRPPVDPATNTRPRTFARVSRSIPLPNFVLSLTTPADALAERLVHEALVPLFRRLHPEKSGWDLSLVNVAVTNMAECAGDAKTSSGRDIGAMFKNQDRVLAQWRVAEEGVAPDPSDDHVTIGETEGGDGFASEARHEADESRTNFPSSRFLSHESDSAVDARRTGSEDLLASSQDSRATLDEDEAVCSDEAEVCDLCGALMPAFAMAAHARFHTPGE